MAISTSNLGGSAADVPSAVYEFAGYTRATTRQTLYRLLNEHRHRFSNAAT